MTTSGYVLARAYNYEPKARMNSEGRVIAKSFSDYSSDVERFFAIRYVTDESREKEHHELRKW